jgi:hypothetical protein
VIAFQRFYPSEEECSKTIMRNQQRLNNASSTLHSAFTSVPAAPCDDDMRFDWHNGDELEQRLGNQCRRAQHTITCM